jgi:two-component system response regulator AtoC
VLIVEDDEDTREIYAWCMRAAGWHTDAVTNGLEALAVAASFAPDVIVMDLHMPELSGIEATRRLKRDTRTAHIPVVACTAYGRLHVAEVVDAGFDEVVDKPCTPEELRALIEQVLARRGSGSRGDH